MYINFDVEAGTLFHYLKKKVMQNAHATPLVKFIGILSLLN
jgi:hypothetical protein